jgi:hypothetical protein
MNSSISEHSRYTSQVRKCDGSAGETAWIEGLCVRRHCVYFRQQQEKRGLFPHLGMPLHLFDDVFRPIHVSLLLHGIASTGDVNEGCEKLQIIFERLKRPETIAGSLRRIHRRPLLLQLEQSKFDVPGRTRSCVGTLARFSML